MKLKSGETLLQVWKIWQSTHQVSLVFHYTKEEARHLFCESYGWKPDLEDFKGIPNLGYKGKPKIVHL